VDAAATGDSAPVAQEPRQQATLLVPAAVRASACRRAVLQPLLWSMLLRQAAPAGAAAAVAARTVVGSTTNPSRTGSWLLTSPPPRCCHVTSSSSRGEASEGCRPWLQVPEPSTSRDTAAGTEQAQLAAAAAATAAATAALSSPGGPCSWLPGCACQLSAFPLWWHSRCCGPSCWPCRGPQPAAPSLTAAVGSQVLLP